MGFKPINQLINGITETIVAITYNLTTEDGTGDIAIQYTVSESI